MNYFHNGYHLLAMILQYACWGLVAALGVYVILPLLAAAFIFGILNSVNIGKKGNQNDEQL